MSATPLVSVVMNGFNSEVYLEEALASVLAQTFTDWELVFWDNQSEDATAAIVKGVGDPRIHFYCAPRRMSLAEGRNEAIARTRGAWIAFLDCDDRWMPDKLERQVALLRDHRGGPVGIIYGRTLSFSARGAEGETIYRYTGRALPEGRIVRQMLVHGNLIPIQSAMVSRAAIEAVGPIPAEYTFAEDYYLFTSIAERFDVLCLQTPCCEYRVHAGSATARNKLASHREGLSVLERFAHLLTADELKARRAIYGTLIGIELARSPGSRVAGVLHLVRHGSLRFLVAGTVRTLLRRVVRRQRPYS